jgi:hypothetical protein
MKNEHQTANKGHHSAPGSLSSGAGDGMTPEELVEVEEHIVHGDKPGEAPDPADDADRMTKSGRLNLNQVKDAIKASDEDN